MFITHRSCPGLLRIPIFKIYDTIASLEENEMNTMIVGHSNDVSVALYAEG